MGMYATKKEIPAAILEKVLSAPDNADFVDSVLFTEEGDWKAELLQTSIDDDKLR
ncbi:MAG: hypothetical protein H7Z43_12815 [Clostridia bacterium]|nr:hypothetical protein [Deltaproteobacteria bacterium]